MIDSLGKRIMVVGSGGSGKSTLSKELGRLTGLPVIHLDKYFWNAGWVATPRDEWIEKQLELLSGSEWIADGNYAGTLEVRLEKADTVIFLDANRFICVLRALKRWLTHIGKIREDLAQGCPEKMDMEFLAWIWRFPGGERQKLFEKLKSYGNKVIILKNRREVSGFLKQFK